MHLNQIKIAMTDQNLTVKYLFIVKYCFSAFIIVNNKCVCKIIIIPKKNLLRIIKIKVETKSVKWNEKLKYKIIG